VTFDELVAESFKELEPAARETLDGFTPTAADEDARAAWRLMCLAAVRVIGWRADPQTEHAGEKQPAAKRCLRLVNEIKDQIAQGAPFFGSVVQDRLEELQSELIWLRDS
jgi:hypothetical protein